jgi:hypothetical protein
MINLVGCERKLSWPVSKHLPEFAYGDTKRTKTPVMIIDVSAEFRKAHLPNTSQKP